MLDRVSGGTLAGATTGDQCGLASRRPGTLPGQEEARLSGELRRAIGSPTRRTTTVIVADPIPAANDGGVTELQRAAFWARDSFEIHWGVCRTARAGEHCQRCEDLDIAAFRLECAALEAGRVG